MERFIRSDQYHYIKNQSQNLLNGHKTSNDTAVKQALQSLTNEKVLQLFSELTPEQEQLIAQASEVNDDTEAILYFSRLKQYVVPFPKISEEEMKQLFPKVKKLKVPFFRKQDWTELSYIGWNDPGANRRYIITYLDGELTSISGHFKPLHQKSICSICHEQEKVGLFTSTIKSNKDEETISRGNYICYDSQTCNENIKSRKNLETFVRRMKK